MHAFQRLGAPLRRAIPRPGRAIGILVLGALVVVAAMSALVTGGAGVGSAADPFQAGQRAIAETRVVGAAAAPAIARAAHTAGLLGLAVAARQTVAHVTDRFADGSYDEVTDLDANDRMLALQRFDADGTLVAAMRFGWTGDGGPALRDDAAAGLRAGRLLAAVGSPMGGAPRVAHAASGGWTVSWTRTVAGIPIPGDGVRVQLWSDGSLHGLSRTERELAAAPSVTLDRGTVRRLVDEQLDRWFPGPTRGLVVVTSIDLAWVAPNDTFAPSRPDAPGSVLRLAWLIRVATTGTLGDSLRALEIYLDAGDGSLLGGDVLR
jgi:hypothetical protein